MALAIGAGPTTAENHDADDHDGHDSHGESRADHHLAVSDQLRVLHGWTRATDHDHARVFMEIENIADAPVRLTGGRSPIAANVELVGFSLVEGEGVYEPVSDVPVMPGRDLVLAPQALALALEDIEGPLIEGSAFPLALTTDRGRVEMTIVVEAADAQQHSHAGHAH
ncbi:copper chaperone PCu(A)C [Spiribacter curvatus]|uniref:copper chaperone PCu(A)C n=1 Tax=Spiribacter curvatus TaxID=1335757 RepID=UPI000416116D|nr:copper chaperone PCu(A)C [Spiribacter curvatus]